MHRALGCVLALFMLLTTAAHAADQLNGRYYGIDDAAGASVSIAPDADGFSGVFFDPLGNSQEFKADAVDDAAEAVLDMDQRTILLRMAPLPYGAQISLIPFDESGNLILENSRSLVFLREGTQVPQAPADFVDAPRDDCRRIAGYSFLTSYQFWEPQGVVNGYLCLPEKMRRLIEFFPEVQLDVLWKLCLSPGADLALGRALKTAGLGCPEVLDGLATIQRQGRFDQYKQRVEAQRLSLRMSIRCADGYLASKEDCDAAARRLSQAAVSLRTPAMFLSEWR